MSRTRRVCGTACVAEWHPIFKKLCQHCPGEREWVNVGNLRCISLIDVECKAYLLILLDRTCTHEDRCFLDEQHGFRPERGPGDGQFCQRRLVEVASVHAVPVYAGFVDFKQALDSLDRDTLWAMLKAYGVHPKLVALIQDLCHDTTARDAVVPTTTYLTSFPSTPVRDMAAPSPPHCSTYTRTLWPDFPAALPGV